MGTARSKTVTVRQIQFFVFKYCMLCKFKFFLKEVEGVTPSP